MKQVIRYLIVFGILSFQNLSFAQNKNRITLQTGLFHCLFDGTPLMNLNYQKEDFKPFHGVLVNSAGIQYRRNLNERSALQFEVDAFWEMYYKNISTAKKLSPSSRNWETIKVNYCRIVPLSSRLDFVYGGGINFRRGLESIFIARYGFESETVDIRRNDVGLNAFAGIDYTPVKWLTLSTSIDFLGLVYIHDKAAMKRLKERYDLPQFPSRYDLSFNLGIGFNF